MDGYSTKGDVHTHACKTQRFINVFLKIQWRVSFHSGDVRQSKDRELPARDLKPGVGLLSELTEDF